jgi:hypothetical protein
MDDKPSRIEANPSKAEITGGQDIPEADPPRPVEPDEASKKLQEQDSIGCDGFHHPAELVFTVYHNVAALQPGGDGLADVKLLACSGCNQVMPDFKAIHTSREEGEQTKSG